MKSILYVGGFELPDKNAAAQRVVANAYILQELGYKILLYGVDKNNERDHGYMTDCIEYCSRKYPISLLQWFFYLTSIKEIKKEIKKMPDIGYVVCYNFPAIALWRLKNYCKKRNISIVADVTEWYQGEGNIIYKLLKDIDTFIRMKIVHFKMDGIIAISKYLENYYKNRVNTIYIPPLVNKKDSKWNQNDINHDNENYLRLAYAGSPGKNKDKINKIVEFLYSSKRRNIELNIIGITENEFLNMYPEMTNILSQTLGKIKFHGRISHEKVLNILKEMDFSIFFREKNIVTMAGFPTKFVESISCGVPVITTRTSDLWMYLKDGYNGFWIDDNIEKSLEKILERYEIENLKGLKKNVDTEMFNFSNYIHEFSLLFSRK